MLSARSSLRLATSALLRRPVRRLRAAVPPAPTFLAPSLASLLLNRSFSQSPNSLKSDAQINVFKRRLSAAPTDATAALAAFQDLRDGSGFQLSGSQASGLLKALADHRRVDECAEFVAYCQEQELQLRPFARIAAFQSLCLGRKFGLALQLFEGMRADQWDLQPWAYGWALDAATRTNQQELVGDIFKALLTSGEDASSNASRLEECDLAVDVKRFTKLLRDACDRGVKFSTLALRALDIFAYRSRQSDLGLQVLSMMQSEDLEPTLDFFAAVILACVKDKRWSDVINIYEVMPEKKRLQLTFRSLSTVVVAHVNGKSDELKLCGLEIFAKYKDKVNEFAWNAAIEAHLHLQQLDSLFALADEMKHRGIEWNGFTYRIIILANIRSGSIANAEKLLQAKAKQLKYQSAPCYRELIEYYVKTQRDPRDTCGLCMAMIRNNNGLLLSDWCTALELAMQLPDDSVYWGFRDQIAAGLECKLPAHVMKQPRVDPVLPSSQEDFEQTITTSPAVSPSKSQAIDMLEDVRKARGRGLTVNKASQLLEALAKHKRLDECAELWGYCQEEGIPLKPFAFTITFQTLYDEGKYSQALELFEIMRRYDLELKPLVYGFALHAAINTSQQDVVNSIIRYLFVNAKKARMKSGDIDHEFDSFEVDVSESGILGFVSDMRDRGEKLSEFALRAIAKFADRSSQPDLALEVVSMMKNQGMELKADVYASVLIACGRKNRWDDVIKVYESMPEKLRLTLRLSTMVVAYVHAGNDVQMLHGLKLFDMNKDKVNGFAWNTVLEAYLHLQQFDSLFALADEMKHRGIEWDDYTYRMMILANIRSGCIENAEQLLQAKAKQLKYQSASCYRELIEHYVKSHREPKDTCELCMAMIRDNKGLLLSDWCTALELAMQLPDDSVYWEFREQMNLFDPSFERELPAHLLKSKK